jgi:hypothetical protein
MSGIDPTSDDVGREVLFTGNRYATGELERGIITSFNDSVVFVRYGTDMHSKATSRADLEWVVSDDRA